MKNIAKILKHALRKSISENLTPTLLTEQQSGGVFHPVFVRRCSHSANYYAPPSPGTAGMCRMYHEPSGMAWGVAKEVNGVDVPMEIGDFNKPGDKFLNKIILWWESLDSKTFSSM